MSIELSGEVRKNIHIYLTGEINASKKRQNTGFREKIIHWQKHRVAKPDDRNGLLRTIESAPD